jgi:hypothetical protein
MLTLTKFQIGEKPMGFRFLSMPDYMEVLAYPDMVMYASGVQESKPSAPDKLSVCHKVCNTAFTGKPDEPGNKFHAFLRAGVASLVHHLEDNRKAIPHR